MLSLLLTALAAPALPQSHGPIAIRAGEIHAVEGGRIHKDGVLLIEGGRIVALGSDVVVPAHAEVIDYGPGSVLVPGFVAAGSRLAEGAPSERTAEPGLKAIDGFDFYSSYVDALAGGVTSAYITPARGRLIAGQAAVVKLAGDDEAERILKAPAAIHGAVSAEARRTPGYWQPPVPATSDVGLGVPLEQLPRTTMGAVLALGELLDGAAAGRVVPAYGPHATQDLAPLMAAKLPWRLTAVSEEELRAVLHIAVSRKLPVILDGAHFAGGIAAEISAAKAGVVYELPFQPGQPGQDRGVDPDAPEPSLDVPARLRAAGVPVAFSMPSSAPLRDLRLAAILGSRGGLSDADALRGLTLTPAEFYGVADRVGSLAAGKHADFAVFQGNPLDATSTVRATWVGGKLAYEPQVAHAGGGTLVVRADELHLGDGHVLRPGEVLVRDGRIAEVGERVGRPAGAVVLHAPAAMPGMIDMLSRVGLGGSRRTPATDFRLGQIVAPGDSVGLAVARAGVTTVVMDPPGGSASGVPMMAYRPAAQDFDGMVVADPVALRFGWSDANRLRAGAAVRDALAKAVDYQKRWREYEEKIAAWKPKPVEPEVVLPEKPAEEAKPAEGEEKKEEAKEEEKEKKPASKKRGKDEPKPVDPDPVTGIWTAEVLRPPLEGTTSLRMQVRLVDGKVEGYLRSAALSERLIEVTGHWTDAKLVLTGIGDEGRFALTGTIEEAKLTGQITLGETAIELTAERTTRDYPVAKRSGPSTETEKPAEEPKDKPKEPRADPRLEPLRRALEGNAAVYVEVSRADEIVACVDAFAAVGIRPILVGADDAHLVVDKLVGRVAGVLLSHDVVESRPEDGVARRNRYADLLAAGIPIGFHSAAADGARDLPLMSAYAVAQGLSPVGALRALTSAAADMLTLSDAVGRLAPGLFGDLVLLDGSPLDPRSQVTRVVVGGREVK